MKRILTILLVASAVSFAPAAQAQSAAGILPTNPFYFLKNWSRGVQTLFIRSPLKRAEMALDVLTEKAEELRGVVRILPESDEALAGAARNYEEGSREAIARLAAVSPDGAGRQVFLRAAEIAGRHIVFTDELYLAVRREGGRRALRGAHEAAAELFVRAASEAAEQSAFFERLKAVAEIIEGDIVYLRRAEFFDELAELSRDELLPAEHDVLLLMRDDALARFAGASAAMERGPFFERSASVLSEVIVAPRRLRMLDASRALASGETRERLTILRQEFGRQTKEEGLIEEAEAVAEFAVAEELITSLRDDAPVAYLDRGRFHLKEAEQLIIAEEYAAAFDQASLARLAAEEGLLVEGLSEEDFKVLIDELRNRYDTLIDSPFPKGSTPPTAGGGIFTQIERKIVALSSLLSRGGDSVRIFEGIREAWVMLSTVEAMTDSE